MEKKANPAKSYKGISASERYLVSLAEEKGLAVFGAGDLSRLSGWGKRKAHNALQSLKRKGLVLRLKRNSYALKGSIEENAFRIATAAVSPSYVSFWSALSFYGFTEQQVKAIQLVSTKQEKEIKMDGFLVQTTVFRPEKFFGYARVNGFNIAEKEKALADSLFQPEKSGGLKEVAACLKKAWPVMDKKKFFGYLLKFKNRSLNSRAGYLLEKNGSESNAGILLKHASKGFVKLNPELKKTAAYSKKWKIIVNQEIEGEK